MLFNICKVCCIDWRHRIWYV